MAVTAADAAREHLRAIAGEPRPAGSDAESRAREYCAARLRAAGFDVHESPFEYSTAVGAFGMPAAGALWGVALLLAARAGSAGRPGLALVALGTLVTLLVIVAPRAAADGVLGFPALRRRGVNLVATRGGDTPTLWLVAHVDSKSQPVPMVARVVGVGGSFAAFLAAVTLGVAQALGAPVAGWWTPLAVVGAVLALPVIGSVIGEGSPGALDNASGVATVLVAATHPLPAEPALPARVGVLISSAEEVGLAGARAWARDADGGRRVVAAARGAVPVALNVDGVDDVGALRVMTASPPTPALERALAAQRSVDRGRLPAGVLVDAIALAAEGFSALTVSRGTLRTLARIHTPGDSLAKLRGDGVEDAARLLRRLAAGTGVDRA